MAQPRTKGVQFRSFLRALKRLRGEEAHAATLDLLRGDFAEMLRHGTLVTGGWYPLDWFGELHDAAQRATNEGLELSRLLGRESAQEDFRSGVHRLITLALSPQSIFKWAPKIVPTYYDTGKCRIDAAERGFARGTFSGFEGFVPSLWEDLIGGCTGVMEVAGAKELTTRILSGAKSESEMVLEVRWKE